MALKDVAGENRFHIVERAVDMLARTAQSRFQVLLPETGPEDARTVAERIRLRIDSTRPDSATGVSVSIGIA